MVNKDLHIHQDVMHSPHHDTTPPVTSKLLLECGQFWRILIFFCKHNRLQVLLTRLLNYMIASSLAVGDRTGSTVAGSIQLQIKMAVC